MMEENNIRTPPIALSDIKQEIEEEEVELRMEFESIDLVLRSWENAATTPLQPVKIENTNDSDDRMEWENSTEAAQESVEMEQVATIKEENDRSRNLVEEITMETDMDNSLLLELTERNIPSRDIEGDDMVLAHVILPRVLSEYTPEELSNAESKIIDHIITIAEDLNIENAKTLKALKQFYLGCSPQTVFQDINKLRPGDNFAVFVRAQHCAILIQVPVEGNADDVTVATFPGILEPTDIYSRDSGVEVKFLFIFFFINDAFIIFKFFSVRSSTTQRKPSK